MWAGLLHSVGWKFPIVGEEASDQGYRQRMQTVIVPEGFEVPVLQCPITGIM
jgi:hypothetical protein